MDEKESCTDMTDTEQVEEFILELTNESRLDHSSNLFESGLLSSLDVLDLIIFIESSFDISISDTDATMENFGSIHGIVDFIRRATGSR